VICLWNYANQYPAFSKCQNTRTHQGLRRCLYVRLVGNAGLEPSTSVPSDDSHQLRQARHERFHYLDKTACAQVNCCKSHGSLDLYDAARPARIGITQFGQAVKAMAHEYPDDPIHVADCARSTPQTHRGFRRGTTSFCQQRGQSITSRLGRPQCSCPLILKDCCASMINICL